MSDYKIHVNDTPEKEDFLVVIVIDEKYKTEASFALPRDLKHSAQLRLIKAAIAKVKFLNEVAAAEKALEIKKNVSVKKKTVRKKKS